MGILDGKVAIVTGAGHGIGRGHALEMAKEGARIVVNDLGVSVHGEGQGKDADLTRDLIIERGGDAVSNYEDVADYDGAGRMIQQAIDTYGRLDILVNNAGIVRDATIWNLDEQAWDSVIRVHLKGTYAPTHHAARHWREQYQAGGEKPVGGRVINTTSGAGLTGNFGQANYTAAKQGIAAFTMTVSLELYKFGVTVNCIGPAGATRITGTMPGAPEVREPDEIDGFDPMDPSLSSPVVAWLASDQADHVTGQVIRVVRDRLVWMRPWSDGPEISGGGERFDPAKLSMQLNTDIFGTRAPGLRY